MAHRLLRLVAIGTCLLALGPSAAPAVPVPLRHGSTRALEGLVLGQINVVREAHGLRPLAPSIRLSAAARQHSAEMAARGYFDHDSANGSSFDSRIERYYPMGQHRYWSVGENLLYSSPDVDAAGAVSMWMRSPPHRANLLSKTWREIGLSAVHEASAPGAYHGLEVTILTADFGVRR